MVSRRRFTGALGCLLAMPFADEKGQAVHVNLPAYRLRLHERIHGFDVIHTFPVGIGKGAYGRRPTPVLDGSLTEKRYRMNIRYARTGKIIRWDRTFDESGSPFEQRMPYKRMRAIQMELTDDDICYTRFVIHSTTDEFTVGIPASSGCLRVGIEDMLSLYKLVAPDVRDGTIDPIPLSITYDVVEIEGKTVVFHADVYRRGLDYVEEFRRVIDTVGLNPDGFDHRKVRAFADDSHEGFQRSYDTIMNTLSNDWPNNFIPDSMKDGFHRKVHMYEFLP